MKKSLGIYVHIPFCLKKCHYCDFCSFPDSGENVMRAYTDELCRRMERDLPSPSDWKIDTVYFGGGTPTLLPADCFASLLKCLNSYGDLSPSAEITCECNPATADLSYLAELRRLGINRLSIGLQSVHDNELRKLGRAHSFQDFLTLYQQARDAGFDNISADLMYGIPDGTLESFRQSLHILAALAPEHISAYGLKIEDGTVFAKTKHSLLLPDEDTEYAMYLAMTESLGQYGYRKYEISNFAKEGKESRHNLRYWQREDYLGFGVAAHSCFEGIRFGNSRDLGAFLRGEDITEERTVLTPQDDRSEWLMLGLRLTEGISLSEFAYRYGAPIEKLFPQISNLLSHGYLKIQDNRLSFTDQGFFVSNTILSELLDIEPIS